MNNVYTITNPKNENVFIHVMPGHFISANNHINYYVGTSDIKHNLNVSVDAAKLMAEYYNTNAIQVDTVLCLYETQALGAYLAMELSSPTMMSPNPDQTIFVVGSEYDAAGNLIFRDNLRRNIFPDNSLIHDNNPHEAICGSNPAALGCVSFEDLLAVPDVDIPDFFDWFRPIVPVAG